MNLKTNYKNDAFAGKRVYKITDLGNGLANLDDQTEYQVEGDIFNADDINATNTAVNAHDRRLTELAQDISDLDGSLTRTQSITLRADGWSPSAPYKQVVMISGMRVTDAPTTGLIYPDSMTPEQKQLIDKCSDMITGMETFDGCLEVACAFACPTTDLIVGLKGR